MGTALPEHLRPWSRFAPVIGASSQLVFVDFETRSRVDLKKAGTWVYSRDESTEVLLAGVADGVNGSSRIVDAASFRVPPDAVVVSASLFDEAIYRLVVTDGSAVPWIDVFQLASFAGIQALGLDHIATMLGLQHKLTEGRDLIRRYSRPDENGRFRAPASGDRTRFEEYCLQDVRVLQAIWRKLSPLYPAWRESWMESYTNTLRINARGIAVDGLSALRAYELIQLEQQNCSERLQALTRNLPCGPVAKLMSPKIPKLLRLDNGQESTVAKASFEDPVLEEIRQLRLSASSAAPSKLPRIAAAAAINGRVHDSFVANGTHTGRMNSRGIQLLNLPRGSGQVDEELFKLLHNGSRIQGVSLRVRDALRQFIRAEAGNELIVADFNAIEARVLPWLAGEEQLLEWFRDGTDVYLRIAETFFRRPLTRSDEQERAFGKLAVLSLGYGAGWRSLVKTAPTYGVENLSDIQAQELRNLYVQMFPRITQFWTRLLEAAKSAVSTPGERFSVGAVAFEASRDFLGLRLPSGRVVRYLRPSIDGNDLTYARGLPESTQRYTNRVSKARQRGDRIPRRTDGRERLWHGGLTNNVVQATAVDVLMCAISNVHGAGFDVIAAIHDEVVVEAPIGEMSVEHLCQLMTTSLPSWADGLPLAADGFSSVRYRKG